MNQQVNFYTRKVGQVWLEIKFQQEIDVLKRTILPFLLLLLLMCSCNPCRKTNCENGGVCNDGTCQCPDGYYGDNCEIRSAPAAFFTANRTTILTRETIIFTDGSSLNPETWRWKFSGGVPGSFNGRTPPPIRFDKTGVYAIELTVTNSAGSKTKIINITVNPGPNMIAYSGQVAIDLFPNASSKMDIRFARYSLKSDGTDVYVLAKKGGVWKANTWTQMFNQLGAHGTNLNPATWVGGDGKWILVWDKNNYTFAGLPIDVLKYIKEFSDKGYQFIRIDRTSEGDFAILCSNSFGYAFVYSQITLFDDAIDKLGFGINKEDIRGFAFGASKSWAIITKYNYAISSNIPNSLATSLANLKSGGYEFVDIEIGDTGWILVYR